MGKLVRCISDDGALTVMACDTTDVAAAAQEIHGTSKVASAALGRLLTAGAMMGAALKGRDDTLTLTVNGSGPLGSVVVVADSFGSVKGYAANPETELALRPDGKLDVGGAVGRDGFLTVVKDLGMSEPYVGKVPLVSGEIAEDITSYYAVSEQIPTVCALGVLMAADKSVLCSGGLMISLLPGADAETIDAVENDVKSLMPVTKMLANGMTPEQICKTCLPSFNIELLDECEPRFRCDCSRERVSRALIAAGRAELEDMAKDNSTEVCCRFCNKKYVFTGEDILQLIKASSSGA